MLPDRPSQVLRSALSPRRLVRRFRLRWVLLFLVACVVWMTAVVTEPVSGGVPASEERAVASSPEAAARFFRKLASAARGGRVELSITETEATSALDAAAQLIEIQQIMATMSPEELEELDTPEEIRRVLDARRDQRVDGVRGRIGHAMNPRLRFRDAQVRFLSDGRVVVSGFAQAWSRRAPVYMDAAPTLEAGRMKLEFKETRLGRMKVPAWMLRGPAELLALMLGLGSDYARVETLRVEAGRLVLSGSVELPPALVR